MTELIVAFKPENRVRAAKRARERADVCLQPARAARALALAYDLRRRLEAGEFEDFASMARALGFSRTRITQLMDLLLLAPDIQEELLFLQFPPGPQPLTEEALHLSVLRTVEWPEQRRRWDLLRTAGRP